MRAFAAAFSIATLSMTTAATSGVAAQQPPASNPAEQAFAAAADIVGHPFAALFDKFGYPIQLSTTTDDQGRAMVELLYPEVRYQVDDGRVAACFVMLSADQPVRGITTNHTREQLLELFGEPESSIKFNDIIRGDAWKLPDSELRMLIEYTADKASRCKLYVK